jgi:hypothetical protein
VLLQEAADDGLVLFSLRRDTEASSSLPTYALSMG